jgi:threonine/homoserine/homoserine lactone efflux protein
MEAITDFYFFLLSVIFISLSGVMMPGPVFAVTVTKGYKNKLAGILIALGHGVIEFPLIFIIYFGFAWFFYSSMVQIIISFAGGLIMIYMGLQTFKAGKKSSEEYKSSKHGSFIAGVLTTTANPYFFLWWITIGTALIMNASIFGFIGVLLFAIAHWSCDLLWNTLVSLTIFKSRRFWTRKVQTIVFGFCFVVLVGFGVWFMGSALLKLISKLSQFANLFQSVSFVD